MVRTPFLVALAFLSVPLAGCFDGAGDAAEERDDPSESSEAVHGAAPVRNATRGQEFVFLPADYDYEESLVRFAITSAVDIKVEASYHGRLSQYGADDECLAASVTSPVGVSVHEKLGKPVEGSQGFSVVQYRTAYTYNAVRARADSQGVSIPVLSETPLARTGDANVYNDNASWFLPAGRQVLIEFGGTSPAYPGESDENDVPHEAEIVVRVSADATIERLPDSAILCGSTFYGADGGAFIEGPLTAGTVTVLSSLALETQRAGTLAILFDVHGRTEGTALFLGEEIPIDVGILPPMESTRSLTRNASEPGEIRIDVQESIDMFAAHDAWVMADADWTRLVVVPPNSLDQR